MKDCNSNTNCVIQAKGGPKPQGIACSTLENAWVMGKKRKLLSTVCDAM